jgi:lysozyme
MKEKIMKNQRKEQDNCTLLIIIAAIGLVLAFTLPEDIDAQGITDFMECENISGRKACAIGTLEPLDWQKHAKPFKIYIDVAGKENKNMRTSSKGIAFIKRHEGLRLTKYKDSAGFWTVGYGHLIKRGEKLDRISQWKADQLLKKDLRIAENVVNKLVRVHLSQNQFDALVSFAFNVGGGAFQRSTLLKHVNNENYGNAKHQFMQWVKAGGSKNRGLINRRKAEKLMFAMR